MPTTEPVQLPPPTEAEKREFQARTKVFNEKLMVLLDEQKVILQAAPLIINGLVVAHIQIGDAKQLEKQKAAQEKKVEKKEEKKGKLSEG
jgi:hypothetical protein